MDKEFDQLMRDGSVPQEVLSVAAAKMGRKGGKARAAAMAPERRAEIAKAVAAKRWGAKI